MLKFKYIFDSKNFSDMEAFQKYLNEMGTKGYELVQWDLVNASLGAAILSILITWKIEDHDS